MQQQHPLAAEDAALAKEYLGLAPDRILTHGLLPECWNVVAQAEFQTPTEQPGGGYIDQLWVLRNFADADFKRGKFPAVTMRLRPPFGSTHLLFRSGKMMIMGIHSPIMATYSYQMQRMAFIHAGKRDYCCFPIQLENSVYSFHAPYRIRIQEVSYEDSRGFFSLIPELFPGLIYKMKKPAISMLIFESGSVMVLGVRDPADLKEAFEIVTPMLEKHQYQPTLDVNGVPVRPPASSASPKGAGAGGGGGGKRANSYAMEVLNSIRYMPYKNKAEYEALLRSEIARRKAAEREEAETKKRKQQEAEARAAMQSLTAKKRRTQATTAARASTVAAPPPPVIQDMPALSIVPVVAAP